MAVDINKLSSLRLGYVGENKSRTISIDVSDWLDRWPDAVIDIAVRRPLEDGGYIPEETTVADGILTWVVTRADVAVAGTGSAQIRAIQESTGKCFVSRVVHTIIEPSITGDLVDDAEQPEAAWVERVLVAAEETKRAAAKVEAALEDTQGMLSASVSVKAFGAVGDGVVDDTDAFQAAADSGYNIYVPQERGERYRITRSINVTKYGQKWIGSRRGWDYGQDLAGIYAENLDCLFNALTTPGNFAGGRFVFDGLNLKHVGLFPGTAENKYKDKVTMQGTAILIDCTTGGDNNDSLVCDCSVDGFETAIEMHGRGFTVRDCFLGGTDVAIKSYYTFDAPDRPEGEELPGDTWQQYDTGYRGIAVRGNKFHGCTTSCITFYNDYPFNISIENNLYDGGGSGYFVTFEGILTGALINGNSILSCYAVKANGALVDGIVFTGNDVGTPKAGLYTKQSPVIYFTASTVVKNLLVSGNAFRNCPYEALQISNYANTEDYHAGIICTSNMILNPCNVKTSGVQGAFTVSKYTNNIIFSNNTVLCDAIPADVDLYLLRSYGGQMAPKSSFIQDNSLGDGVGIAYNVFSTNGCVIQPNSGTVTLDPAQIQDAVNDYLENNPIHFTETDPTVPNWAKQAEKPTYTAQEVGALDASSLGAAVNDALAQAKASGEFKGEPGEDGYTPVKDVDYFDGKDGSPGKDGQDGSPGKDGTSVTIKSVSESSADGGNNVVTFSDGTTLTVKNGSKGSTGEDGKTPVKGVDYFDGAPGAAGKDGTSATHSWNGTVLTVTSASGTSSADLKGQKGDTGETGSDGRTPVKGTDYFTAADKAEMVNAVKAALTSETWTFTLADGSTVTRKVVVV